MPNSLAFSARVDLERTLWIVDAFGTVGGRHIVVDYGERLLRRAHLTPSHTQAFEGLWARHLVHEVTVDIYEADAVGRLVNEMRVPDLVVKAAGLCHCGLS